FRLPSKIRIACTARVASYSARRSASRSRAVCKSSPASRRNAGHAWSTLYPSTISSGSRGIGVNGAQRTQRTQRAQRREKNGACQRAWRQLFLVLRNLSFRSFLCVLCALCAPCASFVSVSLGEGGDEVGHGF